MCGGMIKLSWIKTYLLFIGLSLCPTFASQAQAETWICSLSEKASIHSYFPDGSNFEKEAFSEIKGQLVIGSKDKISFKTKFGSLELRSLQFRQGDTSTTFTAFSLMEENDDVNTVLTFRGDHQEKHGYLRVISGFYLPRITNLNFWACDKL
jgi:hypothetical protein